MTNSMNRLATIAVLLLTVSPLGAQTQAQRERERRERAREQERERAERAQQQREERAERERDRDAQDNQPYRTRVDTTISFTKGGVVDLSLMSGEIIVTGWSQSQARIRATSERARLRTDMSSSRITVSLDERYRSGSARYEVSVPYGSRVRVRSLSGDLTVQGVRGEVEAHTLSGDADISEASERVDLETVSGDVKAERLTGDIRVATVSGDLDLTDLTGEIDVESVSGEIRLPKSVSKRVRMETVSGAIEFGGSIDRTGRYEFRSHSGTIRLGLPAEVNAVFHMETFSGGLESDFPVTLTPTGRQQGPRVKRFNFTIGSGGADITAETFSGDIVLERGMPRR
jgi:DUF4097 and DUF4098 domain-containing protein YvlB